MNIICNRKTLPVLAPVVVGILYFRWRLEKSKRKRKSDLIEFPTNEMLWNTVMFFPDPLFEESDSTTRQLMWYMEQAEDYINICVFCFNFRMIEDMLKVKAKEGVTVRILTDANMRGRWQLQRAGVKYRKKKHTWYNTYDPERPVDLMHHKFVVIDGKAVLNGSLNWTMPGITENFENVMVTTTPRIVNVFRKEFWRLWEESRVRSTEDGKNKKVLEYYCF